MSYSVYFKFNGEKYKLPVNPEEIKQSRKLAVSTYQVLGEGQVSVPSHYELEEYRLAAEFPGQAYHYVETSGDFYSADHYEKMFRKAQQQGKPVRFIASNDMTDDISADVLIKSIEVIEKAGEEGDKYITLQLQEYREAGKRFVAVQTADAMVKQKTEAQPANPAVTENKTHTVAEGETLWGLAKKYYGDGAQYLKIYEANGKELKNPNLIYPGLVLTIPE